MSGVIEWCDAIDTIEAKGIDRPCAGEEREVIGALQCTHCGCTRFTWMGGCGECCEDWIQCMACRVTANVYESIAARPVS